MIGVNVSMLMSLLPFCRFNLAFNLRFNERGLRR